MTWQFDHVNVTAQPLDAMVRSLGQVLGVTPGYRPPFPFPGAWLYQGNDAIVHMLPGASDSPTGLSLNHIAFRGDEPASAVLARLRSSGLPTQLRQHPDKAAAQIFVQLPGGFVIELEAPLDRPLAELRQYDADPGYRFRSTGK